MATVEIATVEFTTYADVDAADAYMLASINFPTWNALDADAKARGLVEATRALDRLNWQGAYDTFAEREVVEAIISASIELAWRIASGDNAFLITGSTASGVKRLKAGSVEQEFFWSQSIGVGNRFPLPIWELIRALLAGNGADSGIGGTSSTGTCGRDISGIDYGFGGDDVRAPCP